MPPQCSNVGRSLLLFVLLLAANRLEVMAQIAPISLTTSEANALTTFEVKLDLSPTRQQYMTMEFGFGTDEADAFEGFFDSFSATLQKRDQAAASALFFTVDRNGLQVAPNNPGGIFLSGAFARELPTPSSLLEFDYRVSYELTIIIPSALGAADTLFFDLFSNQNGVKSAGYFRNLQVQPPPVVVQSTILYNGLFTDEPDAYLDLVAMTADVPKIRPVQFFQVRGELPVKLTLKAVRASEMEFDYEFRPNTLKLLSAETEAGPFVEVEATFDLGAQFVTAAAVAGPRVFRINSDVPVAVGSVKTTGDSTRIEFRFQARPMTLVFSQLVSGPYVDFIDATFDAEARKVRAPRMPARQTFRLNSEAGYRVKSIQDGSDSWLLHIE